MNKQGPTRQNQQTREAPPSRTRENSKEQAVFGSVLSRRAFLRRAGGVTVATLAADTFSVPIVNDHTRVAAAELGPVKAKQRSQQAYHLRKEAAQFQRNLPLPAHPDNGDETRYANRIGSYSKALPHNSLGEVDLNAYNALIHALSTGEPADFAVIPLGGSVKLTSPQAAYAFALEGPDSHHLGMPAPPTFSSAEEAAEMAELYWQALTREVPFVAYDTHLLIQQAATDLSSFSAFQGPKVSGVVTPQTLFRGNTPGDLTGPYLSQFLWQDIPYGAMPMVQRYRVPVAEDDYMTPYTDWLNIQNGTLLQRTMYLMRPCGISTMPVIWRSMCTETSLIRLA